MPNPSLILHNGKIYTRPDRSPYQSIAVWNGQVSDVGSDKEILRLKARSVETADLKGHTVIPGLSDSHIHLMGYGMTLQTLDLNGSATISEIQRAVAGATGKLGKDAWILGRGWDQEKLREHRYPNKNDFYMFRQPIFLRRVCGHIAVANAPALALAGIDRSTQDPPGGVIEREASSGEPTGVLKEKALDLLQASVPQREAEIERALLSAARRLLRVGLTSLHCIVENALEFKVLRRLKSQGKIRQSIYAVIPLGLLDQFVAAGLDTEAGSAGFRIGGVKLFLDGSLGARTAALTEPYNDDPSTGMLRMGRAELDEVVEKAVGSGFQLSMHAIGDRAVEEAVYSIEKAGEMRHSKSLRHRVEHASLASPRVLSRMRRAQVVVSVQPSFIASDTWAEERLGPHRVKSLYPFRSMLRAGIPIAAGSDGPVEDPDPFRGVWSAVARPGLASIERLTVPEALACYTAGPAYASHSEEYRGSLEPGKIADLLVLDRDPFGCPIRELQSVRVLQTFVAGDPVFGEHRSLS